MKDYTTNNANPSLPLQWNDCTTCGAGITRKTDASQQCRNCYEDQVRRETRRIFEDMYEIEGWTSAGQAEGLWDGPKSLENKKTGKFGGRN